MKLVAGGAPALPILIPVLGAREADARIGAAAAILYLHNLP
jgi:hypothetical protein